MSKGTKVVRVSQHSRNAAHSIADNAVSELDELIAEYKQLESEIDDLKEQKFATLLLMDKGKLSAIRRGTTPAEVFEYETEAMIPLKEKLADIASRKRYAEMRVKEIKQFIAANNPASARVDTRTNRELQEAVAGCLARLCKHFGC